MLDLDQAHPPWAFRLNGTTYPARRVSAQQVLGYCEAVERANHAPTPGAQEAARLQATVRLLRYAYPDKLSYRWRRDRDPVQLLVGLDPKAQQAVMADFFAWHGITIAPLTRGTTSSPPGSASANAGAAAASPPSGA